MSLTPKTNFTESKRWKKDLPTRHDLNSRQACQKQTQKLKGNTDNGSQSDTVDQTWLHPTIVHASSELLIHTTFSLAQFKTVALSVPIRIHWDHCNLLPWPPFPLSHTRWSHDWQWIAFLPGWNCSCSTNMQFVKNGQVFREVTGLQ